MTEGGNEGLWRGGCVYIVGITLLAIVLAFVGGVGLLTYVGTFFAGQGQ